MAESKAACKFPLLLRVAANSEPSIVPKLLFEMAHGDKLLDGGIEPHGKVEPAWIVHDNVGLPAVARMRVIERHRPAASQRLFIQSTRAGPAGHEKGRRPAMEPNQTEGGSFPRKKERTCLEEFAAERSPFVQTAAMTQFGLVVVIDCQ